MQSRLVDISKNECNPAQTITVKVTSFHHSGSHYNPGHFSPFKYMTGQTTSYQLTTSKFNLAQPILGDDKAGQVSPLQFMNNSRQIISGQLRSHQAMTSHGIEAHINTEHHKPGQHITVHSTRSTVKVTAFQNSSVYSIATQARSLHSKSGLTQNNLPQLTTVHPSLFQTTTRQHTAFQDTPHHCTVSQHKKRHCKASHINTCKPTSSHQRAGQDSNRTMGGEHHAPLPTI